MGLKRLIRFDSFKFFILKVEVKMNPSFCLDFRRELRSLEEISVNEDRWGKIDHVLLPTAPRHLEKFVNITKHKEL